MTSLEYKIYQEAWQRFTMQGTRSYAYFYIRSQRHIGKNLRKDWLVPYLDTSSVRRTGIYKSDPVASRSCFHTSDDDYRNGNVPLRRSDTFESILMLVHRHRCPFVINKHVHLRSRTQVHKRCSEPNKICSTFAAQHSLPAAITSKTRIVTLI